MPDRNLLSDLIHTICELSIANCSRLCYQIVNIPLETVHYGIVVVTHCSDITSDGVLVHIVEPKKACTHHTRIALEC